ncbi:MAG: AsmA family protein [Pseudomonadota bacterium]
MKRVLIILGVIVGLVLLAAVIVPFLIPTSVYKAQIEKAATNATGREVVLTGDPSLSIFPSISVKIDGASVSNPEGFGANQMITAGEFKANVKLWPLFSSRVEIAQITLSDATVNLERLANGEANWVFESTSEDDPTTEAEVGEETTGGFSTTIGRARLRNANVYYNDRTTDTQYALTDVNVEARLTSLDAPLISSGSGRLNGQAFAYEIDLDTIADLTLQRPASLIASLETDYGTVSYDGALTLGETPNVDGAFSLTSETLSSLIAFFGADLPIRAEALKRVTIEGRATGAIDALNLDLSKTELRADGLELDYTGTLTMTDAPRLGGALKVRADNPSRMFKPDFPLGALAIVRDLDLTADIAGEASSPSLSNVVFTHRGPLLNADYRGSLSLGGAGALNGRIEANSSDLRGLLTALDVVPPEGDRLKDFSVEGNASGTFEGVSLADATLELDDLIANGKVGADLTGARPKVTANLTMQRLDLTPFLGGGDASTQSPSDDWDEAPLALDSLKMLDADLTLTAGSVVLDDITLQDALLTTTLTAGRLSAVFRRAEGEPGFRAFDGAWAGDMTLDASGATPSLTFNANAEGVAAQKLLETLTGFDRLGGSGRVKLDLTSEGNSLKALVSGLDGDFETSLNDGALRGINLAQLVRSTENLTGILASGDLTLASLRGVVSPEAETDFSAFFGDLKFSNGVATVEDLELTNPVVNVTGRGSINLTDRTVNINLTPRVDRTAQGQGATIGVSGIAIPVNVSGPWNNLRYGFDTGAVRAELINRARGRVADEITDRVDGPLGGIIGEVVGGGQRTSRPTTPTDSAPAPETETDEGTEPEPEQSLEDQVRDRVLDEAIGGLFGRDDG